MNERQTNSHEFNEHRGGHPHRHHGGRRFRARFGPPGFDQGAEEPGMPMRPGRPGRRERAGRSYVAEHADELKAPWSVVSGDAASAAADLHSLVRQVHVAAFGVLSAGTEPQMAQARKILAQTRRSLYRILAEEEEADAQAGGKEPEDVPADEVPGRD